VTPIFRKYSAISRIYFHPKTLFSTFASFINTIEHIMKKAAIFFLPLFLAFGANAQSLDEIVQSYAEVNGSAAQWEKVQTLTMKGEFSQSGMSFPLYTVISRPSKIYTEISVMGQTIKQGFDGTQAWMVNPMMGKTTAELMSEEDAKDIKDQAEFDDELLSYKEKGHKVELLGTEDVEGTSCFKIKVEKKNGDQVTKFIDKESFLQVMARTISSNPQMKDAVVETYFSDYKEIGNGLLMWHSMKTKISGNEAGAMTIKSVELNVPVKETVFAFPK
jgi:hypothetical protein